MAKTSPRNFSDRLIQLIDQGWIFFTTLKTAIILLIILAAFAMVGSFVPQNKPFETYVIQFGEPWAKIITFTGLDAYYGTFVFKLVLVLLGISILACLLVRIDRVIKGKRAPRYWGSLVTHIAVLVIFVGALYGHNTGFKDQAIIIEGDSYLEPNTQAEIRLKDFRVKMDEDHRPMSYESDLEVWRKGEKQLEKTIIVNDPLTFDGVRYYQATYGIAGFDIQFEGARNFVHTVVLEPDQSIDVHRGVVVPKGESVAFFVEQFFPDPVVGNDGKIMNATKNLNNPAAFIYVNPDFKKDPKNFKPLGWTTPARALDYEGTKLKMGEVYEYTGLQVKKDPGIPIIWGGSAMLLTGILITSLFPPKGREDEAE